MPQPSLAVFMQEMLAAAQKAANLRAAMSPPVDEHKNDDGSTTLKIPVPGLKRDNVHVEVDAGKINVTGDAPPGGHPIIENVDLPPGTEASQIGVNVADGMITIEIAAPVKRSIPIGGGQ